MTSIANYNVMPGHLARRFQQIAVAAFQAEMDRLGVEITPVQFAALAAMAAHPRIDQASLAGEIGTDRATINGVIDRLELKLLIRREPSLRDRRVRELLLTAEGEAMLARIGPSVAMAQKQMVRGLDGQEAAQLLSLLRKAVDGADALSQPSRRG